MYRPLERRQPHMLDLMKAFTEEITDDPPSDAVGELRGLPSDIAQRRLEEEGKNLLETKKKKSAARIFANQFRDVMVMILLAATVVSAFMGELYDSLTIALIVIVNAALGFIQEYRTEKTLEALEKMAAPTAKVYRDGKLTVLPAEELVRGDLILLEAGDAVPADCFVISADGFMCDESVLTGENIPVRKQPRTTQTSCGALNLQYAAYMGATVVKGRAECEVAVTGTSTQMGQVSGMLAGIEEEQTPLQKRLAELGRLLAIICAAICVMVFAVGVLHGEPAFSMLMTGITVAIAAIPEGLPATVTIALALAVRSMLKSGAFVHKLHSVETLGCASVICTDKTGTITENKMTVTNISTADCDFSVSGRGDGTDGQITCSGMHRPPLNALRELLICACIATDSSIAETTDKKGAAKWQTTGDPTETALLIAAAKGGVTARQLNAEKLSEVPFDSETRRMSVTASIDGKKAEYIKGAPDSILKLCGFVQLEDGAAPLGEGMRKLLTEKSEDMASGALRVLAFAERKDEKTVFLGFAGMTDPPRPEARDAVKLCSRAHIKTVMITGDHKLTAVETARQAGIYHSGDIALTGEELEAMSDEELSDVLDKTTVFARVAPADKMRIVRAFKSKGHVVAMTGDGVNDAPAVKEADIGVAMGVTGTDVTKSAADVVLLDDSFATITKAVEQGRTIYANIRKFVRYLISCNIGEVITMFVGILLGLPVVLLPTQILLVNLVTDGLPAVALSLEPTDDSIMKKRPRKKDESFFSGGLMTRIVFRGLLIGLATLCCFALLLKLGAGLQTARTGALFTLVVSQLLHVFECKSEEKSLLSVPLFNNPFMLAAVFLSFAVILAAVYVPAVSAVFSTVPLSTAHLLTALAFAAVPSVICAAADRL